MENSAPNPELLRSLGKLVRGLSALFWGLPAAPIVCSETAISDVLKPAGVAPALAVLALLLFGLWQIGGFQKQERPWRDALDRARLPAIVNLGLCPFFYWQNQMPGEWFFTAALGVFALSFLLFIFNLNLVLAQLAAMLPDETLRRDAAEFTALNRWLLALWIVLAAFCVLALQLGWPAQMAPGRLFLAERTVEAMLIFLGLTPLAVTMSLIWKTKEVILNGVFGGK
ncbi:MAG: hypothetical protein KGR98_15520 [Verrucomicrobia bacterium]|nr:hypothetical protein [Verrucomicrobiota bacterium]MDE3100522.1 hypothetical protein [Verrucomicrobiota bacterium]